MAQHLGDCGQRLAVFARDQHEGFSRAPGAARATDPVNVVVGVMRHVEIDHVRDFWNVEPARRHIGTDQQPYIAAPEPLQRLHPHRLRQVAVLFGGGEAVADERAIEDSHVALAVAKYEGTRRRLLLQQLAQGPALVAGQGRGLDHGLVDRLGRRRRRRHGQFLGVHQETVGQAPDLARHGGGEEQGLADAWQKTHDAFHVGHEAHVEHAVRLVDHQDLDIGQQHAAALEQVEQPPRCGDQHVDAAVQALLLLGQRLAADQQRH